MAEAHKNSDTGVTLDLSNEEAATLAAIFCRIGGSQTNSPRGVTQNISATLAIVGHNFTSGRAAEIAALLQGSLLFDSFPAPFEPGYYRDNGDGEVFWKTDQPNLRYWTRVKVIDAEQGDEYFSE